MSLEIILRTRWSFPFEDLFCELFYLGQLHMLFYCGPSNHLWRRVNVRGKSDTIWCNFSIYVLGWVFVLGSSFKIRITSGFPRIQGGTLGKMSWCIFLTDISDSCSIDFIRRRKGFIAFSLFSNNCPYLGWNVALYAGLRGPDFSLAWYWVANLLLLVFAGASLASAHRLSTGDVRMALSTNFRPLWRIGLSIFK